MLYTKINKLSENQKRGLLDQLFDQYKNSFTDVPIQSAVQSMTPSELETLNELMYYFSTTEIDFDGGRIQMFQSLIYINDMWVFGDYQEVHDEYGSINWSPEENFDKSYKVFLRVKPSRTV